MKGKCLSQSGDQVQEDLNFNENLFPFFSANRTYNVNDIVRYQDKIYRCHTAVSVIGEWTGATNWEEKDVPGIINNAILGAINANY